MCTIFVSLSFLSRVQYKVIFMQSDDRCCRYKKRNEIIVLRMQMFGRQPIRRRVKYFFISFLTASLIDNNMEYFHRNIIRLYADLIRAKRLKTKKKKTRISFNETLLIRYILI